jgi:hypothetical protein
VEEEACGVVPEEEDDEDEDDEVEVTYLWNGDSGGRTG